MEASLRGEEKRGYVQQWLNFEETRGVKIHRQQAAESCCYKGGSRHIEIGIHKGKRACGDCRCDRPSMTP